MKKIVLPLFTLSLFILGTSAIYKKDPGGIDLKSMDKNVNPAEDFYRYANGTWLRENTIPASESRWGSFTIVAERNNVILRNILEIAAADKFSPPGSNQQKVGTLYRLFMDTLKRDRQGIKPAMADIQAIDKITNTLQLM